MTEQDDYEHVRVLHRVISTGNTFGRAQLNDACAGAEVRGMMLTGIVPVDDDISVAIFVGAEHFVYETNLTVDETIAVVDEELGGEG